MKIFLDRGRNETVPDQWQTQIFLRILERASVIYVSDAPDDMVRDLHMTPAASLDEAISIARARLFSATIIFPFLSIDVLAISALGKSGI